MMQPRASILGGSYWNDGNAGSRYANVDNWPDNSNENLGARGRSDDGIHARRRSRSRRRTALDQGPWSARLSCFGEHTTRSGRAGRRRLVRSRPAAGFGNRRYWMRWIQSHRADPAARELADRHYNRQKIGSPQFVPPGRCCVLLEDQGRAFWVTSWPFAEYVKHDWAGAWICSAFRSEDAGGSIELVRQAIAATRSHFGDPPELGLVTFVDSRKVAPIMIRGVPSFGWVWIKAGFHYVGKTKAGLLVYQMKPSAMPPALAARPRDGTAT